MRPLLANLRQFYQRWAVLSIYGAASAVACVIIAVNLSDTRAHEGRHAGLLILAFAAGLLVAVMQMEVLSRPLSFCLPGHHGVVRRLVLVLGLATSFVLALPFVGYRGSVEVPPAWGYLVLGSAFGANLMAYMAGALLGFTVRRAIVSVGLLPAAAMFGSMVHLDAAVERAMVRSPLAVMVLAGVTAVVGWWWLGRPAWFRRRSGQHWTDIFSPWSLSQTERTRQAYAARRFPGPVSPEIDRFFQRAMGRHGLADLRKYLWGALYPTCALMVSQWKGLAFITLLAAVWAGYSPEVAPFVMGVVPLMMSGFLQPPLGTTLLAAGGRRERFFATAVLILALGAASVVVVGTGIALTYLLAPLAPTFEVKGIVFHLQPVRPSLLLVPLVVIPVVNLLRTLFHRSTAWWSLSMIVVFFCAFMGAIPLGLFKAILPLLGTFGIILLWGFCLAVVHRIAMHGDLARQ